MKDGHIYKTLYHIHPPDEVSKVCIIIFIVEKKSQIMILFILNDSTIGCSKLAFSLQSDSETVSTDKPRGRYTASKMA